MAELASPALMNRLRAVRQDGSYWHVLAREATAAADVPIGVPSCALWREAEEASGLPSRDT
jgi:hypothetical protein